MVTRVTRKNTNLESKLVLTISGQLGLVSQLDYFNKNIAGNNLKNYFLIKKDEFAYNRSYSKGYPLGAIKQLEFYDYGILSTLYILFKTKENSNISPKFLKAYYSTNKWYSSISKLVTEGARNHGLLNISANDFFKSNIVLPMSLDEQKLISKFMVLLEKSITLHQRKLELIKSIYWYYFKESVVFHSRQKITFSNEKWVQHKLKNIAERLDSDRIPITASKRVAGTTPYYGANGIQDYVNGYTHTGENILIAEDGANDISNYPIFLVKGNIWVNNHAHVIRSKSPEISNNFLVYALKAINYSQYLVGGSRAKLNGKVLDEIIIEAPSLPVQLKIAKLLDNLNELEVKTRLHISSLNNVKSLYLNLLFI